MSTGNAILVPNGLLTSLRRSFAKGILLTSDPPTKELLAKERKQPSKLSSQGLMALGKV